MRTGFFGGAFDPIHEGHLKLARNITDALFLERLEFIPNASPPHKKAASLDFKKRTDLIKLAIKDEPRMAVNTMEENASSFNYTLNTLRTLRQERDDDTPMFFLMGMDSLLALDTWHQGFLLTDYVNLAVIGRPGCSLDMANPAIKEYLKQRLVLKEDLKESPKLLNTPCGLCFYIECEEQDVSSSNLREALIKFYSSRDDRALSYLKKEVPALVLKEILDHELYKYSDVF